MSLKDYIESSGETRELTRELLERGFEAMLQQSFTRQTCERCGYEPDIDGYCGFCGHLSHWRRSR
jgi:hypothetical protein